MILYLLLLLNITDSYSGTYDEAVRVAAKATFIQSGYQSQLDVVEKAIITKGNRWLKDNSLSEVAVVVIAVAPVIVYKRIEFHHKNLTFQGSSDKKEVTWGFDF